MVGPADDIQLISLGATADQSLFPAVMSSFFVTHTLSLLTPQVLTLAAYSDMPTLALTVKLSL